MPFLEVSGTKWLLEGTPLEQGAYQVDEYSNHPGWHGRMNYTPEEIKRMCQDAVNRKDQLHFHIGGSKSISMVLDIMSTFDVDWKSLRPRFEHGDQIDYAPEYLEKARKMGIIIVQNPTHFSPTPGFKPDSQPHPGAAMKTLLKSGIPLAIGSDGPFNPFLNILLATTHPMRPTEALTREEAVIAYTSTSAYAEFKENEKGSLTVSKLADVVVLSQDIFTIPPGALPSTRSLMTIVDGKVVHDELTKR
jgi:predicted amidohydrolase YtcJ